MDNVRYNRIKAVLAEQDKTGTWLSEQMAGNVFVKPNGQNEARFSYAMARKRRTKSNLGTVSRWMTNKIQPSVEPLGSAAFIAKRAKYESGIDLTEEQLLAGYDAANL